MAKKFDPERGQWYEEDDFPVPNIGTFATVPDNLINPVAYVPPEIIEPVRAQRFESYSFFGTGANAALLTIASPAINKKGINVQEMSFHISSSSFVGVFDGATWMGIAIAKKFTTNDVSAMSGATPIVFSDRLLISADEYSWVDVSPATLTSARYIMPYPMIIAPDYGIFFGSIPTGGSVGIRLRYQILS